MPEEFCAFLSEPAFNLADTTFCIWRSAADSQWRRGPVSFPDGDDPDGSERLLWALDGNAGAYQEFARDYFELDADVSAIAEVFRHVALTPGLVERLNPERDSATLATDAKEIGYWIQAFED